MKRSIALLLAVCSLLLVACDSGTENTDSSVAESEAGTDESKDEEAMVNRVISVGKPYTTTSQPESRYPDLFGQQITDGQKTNDTGTYYRDVRMVGYTANTDFVIELGDDGKNITQITARTLEYGSDGVRAAHSIRVRGSKDGKTWTTLGTAAFKTVDVKNISTATVIPKKIVDYRFIRVTVNKRSDAPFFFIDEIEVYGDVPESVAESDYVSLTYKDDKTDIDAWKALSTGNAATAEKAENVALGKKYTFENVTFDERAPKNDKMLTDGARVKKRFGENYFVGFKAEGKPAVAIDLGKPYEHLYSFRLHMLGGGLEITLPAAIDIYGSDDGKNYSLVGRVYAPPKCDYHAYTLILPEYIKARYLKFEFVGEGENYWIEEIEVFEGRESDYSEILYSGVDFPKVEADLYWDEALPDYSKKQNLLLGKIQQINASYYMTKKDDSYSNIPTDPSSPRLTDGKISPTVESCYNEYWFYTPGGGAIDFFYDIGYLSSVETLTISLLEYKDWGIARPEDVSVFLSDDGKTWYRVAMETRNNDEINKKGTRINYEYKLDKAYAARFVRFRMEGAMMFIDEFEAIGTKKVTNKTARLADSEFCTSIFHTNRESAEYATLENTTVRAEDIALIWGGDSGSESKLLPYVAYLDENGNIADFFMDGFIYLTSSAGFPSGNKPYGETVKGDWDYLITSTFDGKNGFDKLNETVGTVKEKLNAPDYKAYVYFSIPSIREKVTDFGDVDGDGISEDMSLSENRKKVFSWYVKAVMDEFASRNYEHIEFDGFYWLNEDVGYEVDDSHIITECGDIVKGAGTNFIWVPYYTANRYYLADEMGFDVMCMQPNFMFDLERFEYRFDLSAEQTKWLNMSIEIEHSFEALGDPLYVRNYMLYLYYGVKYGYDEAVLMYFDDNNDYEIMANSKDPMCRMQYDATYKFVKGTLDIYPDVRDTLKLSTAKDTILNAKLGEEGEFALYTINSLPEHGTVSLNETGEFSFYPEKGFSGTVSFTYTYNNYLGESEPCTVEITVG